MKLSFTALALAGALTAGLAGSAALAQDAPPPADQAQTAGGPPAGRHMPNPDQQLAHMTKQLNLSADQQSQIRPLLVDHQQQMQALWQDQSLSRPDRRQKMQTLNQDTHTKIEAILNDQQKQKFEAMQERMRDRRQHGMPGDQGGQGSGQTPPAGDAQPQ